MNTLVHQKWLIGIVPTVITVILTFALYKVGTKLLIGQHQKNVILLLKEWEQQFEDVASEREAFDAIDMYEYASKYYVAGEGYFSSEKMSLRLEDQRRQTLDTIVSSLEKFTGLQYGHDFEKWKEWRDDVLAKNKATQNPQS